MPSGYRCPVGCGKGPFSTENGAVMHAINKSDEQHESIEDKVSAYGELNQETADGIESDTEEDTETSEAGTDSNPTFGGAEPSSTSELSADGQQPSEQPSEQPPKEQPEQSGEPRCLDCEGELVDFTDVERGTYAEIANGKMHVKGDYLCSDCGQWWFEQ